MGAGVSMTRLDHRCSYEAVQYDIRGLESGTMYKNSEIAKNADHNGHTIELRVYDRKGRQIKYLCFYSDCDDRWEVQNEGVRLTWQGMHSRARITQLGTWHSWQIDNESYYEDMDREDQEQREREAREKAARAKAEREAREQEAREKAAREKAAREARAQEAREKAAREKAAREKAEREKAERQAREQEAREKAARAKAEREAREKEAREKEARERAAREKAEREERERSERAAQNRQADRSAAALESDIQERQQAVHAIMDQLKEQRQQEKVNAQRSVGWRTAESKAAQKHFSDLAPILDQDLVPYEVETLKWCEQIVSSSHDERNKSLTEGFTKVPRGLAPALPFFRALKEYLQDSFTCEDASLVCILKTNANFLPPSIIHLLVEKIILCYADELKVNTDLFSFFALIFKQKCTENSPWHQNTFDDENKAKLLVFIETYGKLLRLSQKSGDVPTDNYLEDFLNVLTLIHETENAFPQNCLSNSLEVFADACTAANSCPTAAYDFFLVLMAKDVMIPVEFLDLITKILKSGDIYAKQEKVLRSGLNAGFISATLLGYLEKVFKKDIESTFTESELLEWIGEYVENGGQISIGYFETAVNMMNRAFPNETEFSYLLSILQFCFLNLDSELVKSEIQRRKIQLPFISTLKDDHKKYEMKIQLIQLMSKILNTEFITLDRELLETIFNMSDIAKNGDDVSIPFGFLQIAMQIDIHLFDWFNLPSDIFNITNLAMTRLLLSLLVERLREMKESGECNWEISSTTLQMLTEVLGENGSFSDAEILSNSLTIFGLEIQKKKSRSFLEPVCTNLSWIEKYLKHDDPLMRENAVYVISELVHNSVGNIENYFPYLISTMKNWPTEQAHRYASAALCVIISNIVPGNMDRLSQNFLQNMEPSAFSCSNNLAQSAYVVIEAWAKHIDETFLSDDFKFICQLSLAKYGAGMMQKLFGFALGRGIEPKQQIVEELKKISERSKVHLSTVTILELQKFLQSSVNDMEQKIMLAEIMVEQYSKEIFNLNHSIIIALECTLSLGSPELTKLYVSASHRLASFSTLPDSSVCNIWEIILDARVFMKTRKTAVQTLLLVVKKTPNVLQDEFMDKMINLIGKVDLRMYALFVLCYPPVLQLSATTQKELSAKLLKIVRQRKAFASIETMVPSVDEELSLQLSICILQKMANHKQLDESVIIPEISAAKTFNWMIQWLSIHPEDSETFVATENSKANGMIRADPCDPSGHSLKVEVMIARATIAMTNKEYSKANSWLDKAIRYAKTQGLESFNSKLSEMLAKCYAYLGSHRAAIKLYKMLLILPSTLTKQEITYFIAKSLMASGRYDSAQKIFQELPSGQRFGYFWEAKVCEAASELFKSLYTNIGSKDIAKAQIKFLLTEMQDLPPKQTSTFVKFLVGRGEYYDMSVVSTQPQQEWELEFLKREVYGRACTEENEFGEFEQSYLKLKMFYKTQNSDTWIQNLQALLTEITEVQKDGQLQAVKTCNTIMLFLRIPHKVGIGILSESQTEMELITRLQVEWLKSMLTYHKIIIPTYDNQLRELWSVIKQSPFADEHIDFVEDFLDQTLKTNTLDEIISFFSFCQSDGIAVDTVKSLVNQVFLHKNEEKGIVLAKWKEGFKRNKIAENIDRIWQDFGDSLDLLKTNLLGLYDRGQCNSEEIQQLLQSFFECDSKETRTQDLIDILTVYNSYNLSNSSKWDGLHTLWKNTDSSEWKTMIRDVALHKINSSSSTESKPTNELVKEFLNINNNDEEILQIIERVPFLITKINEAQQRVSQHSGISETCINDWSKSDIAKWTSTVKHQSFMNEESYLPELLAVMQRAMYLFKGYSLREVGVMSLCILLSSKGKGCLAKIATGEGKSGIVATLAVIKTLQGHTVDIVTSSPILAERDSKEWGPFFSLFDTSAKDNGGPQEASNIAKSCYTKDVVYGDASTFEGDVLRQEFSLLGTRGNRKFDVVVVDEVDSMFIDGSNHSTRLIDKMPQMDCLESLFATIWHTVRIISSGLMKIDGETFALERPSGKTDELIKAVFSVLPADTKASVKCSDATGLKAIVEKFATAMKLHELQDESFRRQVVNILQNRKLHIFFPLDIQAKLKDLSSMSEITATCDLVSEYITSKWCMGSPVNLRNTLQVFLNIEIFVYDVENENIVLSPVFHSDLLDDLTESDDTKQKLRFFVAENELYSMSKVPNDRHFIASKTEELVRSKAISSKYKTPNDKAKLYIPGHLFNLFNTKIDEWIQSSIQAMFSLELNRDYIIKPSGEDDAETITPVDFKNTGVTQESCVWGEGLHQFLQIKHKLKITPEYLATNFISNLSFFKRYGQNIFGLTGTLGDENEVGLLKHLYSLLTVNVPTFKPKRLLELRTVVANDATEWLASILNSAAWELNGGRSVLIICKTIVDVNKIHEVLKGKLNSNETTEISFRLYSRSDESDAEAAVTAELKPGTVVIATNLAGRGTNIKLSKSVVQNGGLHVIISFLPTNLRVEEQAAGRAARSGEPGTCQLVLNAEMDILSYEDEFSLKIENIKAEREANESVRVDHIKTTLKKELHMEEKQFQKFCKVQSSIKSLIGSGTKTTDRDHILNGIGERWAVQLEETKTRCDILDWDMIDEEFDRFFDGLLQEFTLGNAIRNPSYHILKGNDLILTENFKEGIQHFEKAIGLDTVFVQNAHYNHAYAIINLREDGYKEKAMKDLQKTSDLIQNYAIPYLSGMHYMIEGSDLKTTKQNCEDDEMPSMKADDGDSDFTKQIVNRINFYYLQLRSITEASEKINEIKGDIVAKFSDPKDFYEKHDQEVNYSDISNMKENGFVAFMYVEQKPVPWYNILAVLVLGLVQVAVGACLCLVGAVNFGIGLISEGIGDIITGITAAVTGEFSWQDYWKEKGISIGVSLVVMGAGAILKAVAKLPKLAIMITKVTSAATKVGKGLAGVAIKIASKAKGVISYAYKSSKCFVSKLITPFRNIGSKITLSRAWTFSRDCVKAIKKKVIDLGRKIGYAGKMTQDKLFGIEKLSVRTSKNFEIIGRVMVQQGLEIGLIKALDHGLLGPIGDEIEKQIQSVTAEFLQCELAVGTALGDKIDSLLKSCMGKKVDQQITVEIAKAIEDCTSYKQQIYQKFASEVAGEVLDVITNLDGFKPKTGRQALLKFFASQVLSAVKRSVTLGESIKSLTSMLPDLIKQLQIRLDSASKHVKTHSHEVDCEGKNNPVNDNDVPKVKDEYVKNWSKTIAKRMRNLIINNIMKPHIESTATHAIKKLTNQDQLNKIITQNAPKNRVYITEKAKETANRSRAYITEKAEQTKQAAKKSRAYIKEKAKQTNDMVTSKLNLKKQMRKKAVNNLAYVMRKKKKNTTVVAKDKPRSTKQAEIDPTSIKASTNNAAGNDSAINTSVPKTSSTTNDNAATKDEDGGMHSRISKTLSGSSLNIDHERLDDAIDDYIKSEMNSRSSLNIISHHLDEAIELYIEKEGQLSYQESYGSRKNSNGEPLRVLKRLSSSGEEYFSPIVSSPKSGELQIMEFEVHPESTRDNDTLVQSIMVAKGKMDFTPTEVMSYYSKVAQLTIGRKPRFVRSITDTEVGQMDKISRNVLLCRRGQSSRF